MKQTANTDVIEAPELAETTRSGRPTWDERGNTVWEWQTAPGIYSREVTPQQLQILQATELSLVDQRSLIDSGRGHTSTYSHWKRHYQDRFTRVPTRDTELVMPTMRKGEEQRSGLFDQFLKHLGLPG